MRIVSGSVTDFLADFLAYLFSRKTYVLDGVVSAEKSTTLPDTVSASGADICAWSRILGWGMADSVADFRCLFFRQGGVFFRRTHPGWQVFFRHLCWGVVDVAAKGLHGCTQGEDSTRNQSNRMRGSAHGPFSFCQAESGDTPPGSDWETGHDVLRSPLL